VNINTAGFFLLLTVPLGTWMLVIDRYVVIWDAGQRAKKSKVLINKNSKTQQMKQITP
jgi:hypothetical protein